MNEILKKFSLAVEEISSNTKSMQKLVYRAYHEHLSDIDSDKLLKLCLRLSLKSLPVVNPLKISATMKLLTLLKISGICLR